jgi:D-3-phosphoglycerate dehydrogenase
VVEIPKAVWGPLLHGVILRVRPARSARKYAAIWTAEGSPLLVHSIKQASLLKGALGERLIAGAALDVYCELPLRRDHPLLELDNVILTPHAAGITQESVRRLSQGTAREVLRLLAGERPLNLVNPEIWERHLASRRLAG